MNWIYWVISLLIGFGFAFVVYKKDKHKDAPIKWLPSLLRGLLGFLSALLLLAPMFSGLTKEEEKPTIIWLQDISSSTTQSLGNFQKKYKEQQEASLTQLRKKYNVVKYGFGSDLFKDSINDYHQKGTDIAQALEKINNQFQDKNIGAIILASDGIYNEGSNPSFLQFSKPITIYSIALGDSTTPRDIRLTNLYSNKTVALHNSFEIFADIASTGLSGTNTSISLSHQGKIIASQNLQIANNDYATSISFAVQAEQVGLQQYTVSIAKTGAETNIQNNSQSVIVEVKERKTKVLLFANASHPDIATIKDALRSASEFDLSVITNGNQNIDLNNFDILIAYQAIPNANVSIPTWYILGTQNTAQIIQSVNTIAAVQGGAQSDLQAQLNTNFNLFTLPANIQQVLAKMPPLNASVIGAKNASNSLLSSTQGNSIWTFSSGSRPVSILYGEGLWRWSMYEFKNFNNHNVSYELIRQTLSLLRLEKDDKPFKISIPKNNITDNEPAVIIAELRNPNGELINEPEAKLSMSIDGKTLNYNFEKSGSSYQLKTGALAPGEYHLKASTTWKGKNYEDYGLLHVSNIPLEALRTNADYNLMYQLAEKHDGRFFTQVNFSSLADSINTHPNIKTIIHSENKSQSIIDKKWLFFLILALASIEWFLRKFWSM